MIAVRICRCQQFVPQPGDSTAPCLSCGGLEPPSDHLPELIAQALSDPVLLGYTLNEWTAEELRAHVLATLRQGTI